MQVAPSTQMSFAFPVDSQVPSASIKSLFARLDEPSSQCQAIQLLNDVVDYFWPEISEVSDKIEAIAVNSSTELSSASFLLLSKIKFHLGDYDTSVEFALSAGNAFNIEDNSQFSETILSAILDKYIEARVRNDISACNVALESIFTRVIQRCLRDREFKQLIGMSLDCRRLDILEAVIKSCSNAEEAAELLYYTRDVSSNLINCVAFQNQVLKSVISLFSKLPKMDFVFVSDCFIATNQPVDVAQIINQLVQSDTTIIEGIQIAFNAQADATQDFLNIVQSNLIISDQRHLETFKNILSGRVSSRLYMEFLSRANRTDPFILEKTKSALNPQVSLHHQALSCANAFIQAGTTNDEFLRKNLDFLSHASNWAKFSATVSLGSIHRGQFEKSLELLSAYLPKPGVTASSVYSEGGALMALGLIHANHGSDILSYILKQLNSSQSEVIQHGACLGLGISGMASKHESAIEAVKGVLYGDNAIGGEAAGISLGLLMLGSGDSSLISEMNQYAHESQHEKIIRSLALGMALIMYGKQDQADDLIAQLEAEKDPILRFGSVWTVALAYSGTSSNVAVNKLLHFAVSDANDDVRRAAVTALGFVLFQNAEELPRLVELLTESYNPSVRYGAAMALGIAFAGSANKRAIELIMPMCKDFTDYVRQGAFIALAMILMQHNDRSAEDSQVSALRKQLEQVISTRHEDQLAKFGAILAQGILDAGGRNVRLALETPSGHVSMQGIAGLALFCQFWYWYPFGHFLTVSFAPTALVAVTSTLQVPKLSVISNAAPSIYAYPEMTKPVVASAPKKVAAAILSTTAKAAARAKKQNSLAAFDSKPASPAPMMEVDSESPPKDSESKESQQIASPLPESNFEIIDNLSRVVTSQIPHIQFPMDSRFIPVSRMSWKGGVMVLSDSQPSKPFESHLMSSDATSIPDTKEKGGSNNETIPAEIEADIESNGNSPKSPKLDIEMD